MWIKKHLNWSYLIAIAVSLFIPLVLLFATDSPVFLYGIIFYYAVTIGFGEYVLHQKKQRIDMWFIGLIPPLFAIVVMLLTNQATNHISNEVSNQVSNDTTN